LRSFWVILTIFVSFYSHFPPHVSLKSHFGRKKLTFCGEKKRFSFLFEAFKVAETSRYALVSNHFAAKT
jgi:hypothetical protein